MKAAVHTKYNKNNIELEIREVAVPTINENEVLVKVTAAGVNPLDNMISRGEVKIIVPYKLPQVAGNEVVGIIEQKGRNIANFEIGDRVFSRLPSCSRSINSINNYASFRTYGSRIRKNNLYLRWNRWSRWYGYSNR